MSLVLYEHPFALYCWKPLIALYERDVPFTARPRRGRPLRARGIVAAGLDSRARGRRRRDRRVIDDRRAPRPPWRRAAAGSHRPRQALQARLWDRMADGYIATPVQTIVADALRPADAKDPYGVAQAHATLDLAYATLDRQLDRRDHDGWLAGDEFTLADCAAAPALHYADVLHPIDRARTCCTGRLLRPGTDAIVGGTRDRGGTPLPPAVSAALAGPRQLSPGAAGRQRVRHRDVRALRAPVGVRLLRVVGLFRHRAPYFAAVSLTA